MPPPPSPPSSTQEPQPEKLGLILGLGLVGLCCFPAGLVAGVLGLLSYRRALKEGLRPAPVAFMGMGLAALSLALTTSAVVFSMVKNARRDEQKSALVAEVGNRREAAELDDATACDLAKLHYLAPGNGFFDGIECTGKLDGSNNVRTLSGVVTVKGKKRNESTLCLARGHRWFVLSVLERGEACPPQAPVVRGPATTEAALEVEEDAWREAETTRMASERVERFEARVKKLDAALTAFDGSGNCGPAMPKGINIVPYFERRMLTDDRAFDDWDFLTTSQFRGARSLQKPRDRAKTIVAFEAAGPLVVVFDSETRVWPRVVNGTTFSAGQYEGRLVVANFEVGEVLCSMDFDARSSAGVSSTRFTKLESREHALESALEKDFTLQLKTRAKATLKQLTDGSLEVDL
jgi:hypothetical protein